LFDADVSIVLFCLKLAIPDDIMDVDRPVDEDKDSDPNKVN